MKKPRKPARPKKLRMKSAEVSACNELGRAASKSLREVVPDADWLAAPFVRVAESASAALGELVADLESGFAPLEDVDKCAARLAMLRHALVREGERQKKAPPATPLPHPHGLSGLS